MDIWSDTVTTILQSNRHTPATPCLNIWCNQANSWTNTRHVLDNCRINWMLVNVSEEYSLNSPPGLLYILLFEHPVAHHNTRDVLGKWTTNWMLVNVSDCHQHNKSTLSTVSPPWSIHYGCHGNCVSPSYNNVSIYIMLLISLLATNKSQNIFSVLLLKWAKFTLTPKQCYFTQNARSSSTHRKNR